MKLKSLSLPMSFVFFGCLPHWSCGKKEDDTPKAAPSANLRMAIVAGGAASTSSFNLADVPFSGFVNGSIASGAPDEMSVSITKISLANSSTNSETPIFSYWAREQASDNPQKLRHPNCRCKRHRDTSCKHRAIH